MSLLAPLAFRLGGAALAVAAVVAGYHFMPLVGPQARLDRAAAKIEAKDEALAGAATALRVAAAEIRGRDELINTQADQARDDAGDASAFWKGQCRHAFDAGYATCPRGDADPGGVRDLRSIQSAGAFKAPG